MKKRLFAWILMLCLLLTACNPATNSTSTDTPDSTPDEPIVYPEIPAADEPSIQIHYFRKNGDYSIWNLWLWEKGR